MTKCQIAVLTVAFCAAAIAHADGDYTSPTEDRVRLSLGFMHESASTTLQSDSSNGTPGDIIRAEGTFGVDSAKYAPEFQALVRVDERHRLRFDYFELDRGGDATLTAPVLFRNTMFLAGDPVQSDLSLRLFGITYGYSFWHSEKFELAGTFGINSTELSVRARVQTQSRHVDQIEDVAGPFPTVGIDATWVASHRFYFDGRAQYLNVSVDNLSGSLGIYEFDALYRVRPNVSFALGYNIVRVKLASNQTADAGFFDLNSHGPQFFVRVAF